MADDNTQTTEPTEGEGGFQPVSYEEYEKQRREEDAARGADPFDFLSHNPQRPEPEPEPQEGEGEPKGEGDKEPKPKTEDVLMRNIKNRIDRERKKIKERDSEIERLRKENEQLKAGQPQEAPPPAAAEANEGSEPPPATEPVAQAPDDDPEPQEEQFEDEMSYLMALDEWFQRNDPLDPQEEDNAGVPQQTDEQQQETNAVQEGQEGPEVRPQEEEEDVIRNLSPFEDLVELVEDDPSAPPDLMEDIMREDSRVVLTRDMAEWLVDNDEYRVNVLTKMREQAVHSRRIARKAQGLRPKLLLELAQTDFTPRQPEDNPAAMTQVRGESYNAGEKRKELHEIEDYTEYEAERRRLEKEKEGDFFPF